MKSLELVGIDRPLLTVVVPFDVKKGTTMIVDAKNGGLFAVWRKISDGPEPTFEIPKGAWNDVGNVPRMTEGRVQALEAIWRQGALAHVKSVVSYLGVDGGTARRHLRFLTANGFATRSKCKPNGKMGRRAFKYSITKRGMERLESSALKFSLNL